MKAKSTEAREAELHSELADLPRIMGGRRKNKKSRRVRVYDMPNRAEMRAHGSTNPKGHRSARTVINRLLNPPQKPKQAKICLRRYMEWLGEPLLNQLTYVGDIGIIKKAEKAQRTIYTLRIKRRAVASFTDSKEAFSNMLTLAFYGGLDTSVTVEVVA